MKKSLFYVLLAVAPLAAARAATLAHQYTFDEQNVADSAGSANGVPTTAGTFTEAPGFITDTPDNAGYALSVGANWSSGNMLKSGFSLGYGLLGDAGSISLWVKPTVTRTNPHWVFANNYTVGIGVQMNLPAQQKIQVLAGSTNSGANRPVLSVNVWSNIVITWNNNYDGLSGNQAAFYLNNQLISLYSYVNEVDPGSSETPAPFNIGGFNLDDTDLVPTAQFKGYIDNFQIYDGVLTAGEVGYLYNNPGLAVVPEPHTFWLVGLAGMGLLYIRRRSVIHSNMPAASSAGA